MSKKESSGKKQNHYQYNFKKKHVQISKFKHPEKIINKNNINKFTKHIKIEK